MNAGIYSKGTMINFEIHITFLLEIKAAQKNIIRLTMVY